MRRKLKYSLYVVLSSMAYTLVFTICYCWIKFDSIDPLLEPDVFVLSFFSNFIPTIVLVFINWLIVFKIRITNSTVFKIIFDTGMSGLFLAGVNYLFVLIVGEPVNMAGSIFNDVMVLLILETIFFSEKYRYSVQRESLVRQENQRYKYEVLKAQIDPHFLFNSLNILYSLISLDPQKSRDFVLSLSDIYRYVMLQENKNRIHVDEELMFLDSYLAILRIRYDGCFDAVITRHADNLDKAMIIPFTLQLLIENAIKHNEISSKHSLVVNVDITEHGIDVSNIIVPRKAESVSRIGLRYLSQLYAMYDRHFYVEKENGLFLAHVPYI